LIFNSDDNGGGQLIGLWTGSLFGTASVATSASFAMDGIHSATASYVSSSGTVRIQSGNNTVELFNTNSAQRLNVYNTFNDSSNFRRLSFYGSSGDYVIEANATGSGTSGGDLYIKHSAGSHSIRLWTSNTERYRIENDGNVVPAIDNRYNLGTGGLRFANVYAVNFSGSLYGTSSAAQTSSIARGLQSLNNSSIQYDSGQNVWVSNVALDLSTAGIYDGANGVIAATFSDVGHILNDINGIPALDFTNPKQLLGDWSGSITLAQTASSVSPRAWSAISAASAVTWSAAQTTYEDRKTLTVTGPTTMSIQGLYNGWSGVLKVKNGNTGSLLFVTPKPIVVNVGSGSLILSNISASIDVISFDYDGTDLMASVGNTFN
jgi:hypothetical protein